MRNEIRCRPPIIGLLAITLLTLLAGRQSDAMAQSANSGNSGVPKSGEPKSGLVLPQDRPLDQLLEAARKSMTDGDYVAAVLLLQRIADVGDEVLTTKPGSTTLVSAREQAAVIAAMLPADVRGNFETEIERAARAAWGAAQQDGSIEAIITFTKRHRYSAAGLEGLRTLAATFRDTGRHAQAAIAWQTIVRHPRATTNQRGVARLAQIDSLLSAGMFEAAEREVARLQSSGNPPAVAIAGKSVSAGEWIADRTRTARLAQGATAVRTVPAAAASVLPALQPVWSRQTTPTVELQQHAAQLQLYFRAQGLASSPAIRPLVVGRLVLTRTMQDLQAFDATSGDPLWSVPNQEYSWITKRPTIVDDSPFRTTMAAAWHRRLEADSLFGSMATNGKLVVVVQEPDRTSLEAPLSTIPARAVPPSVPPAIQRWNRLCAYEVSSGQLKWQIGGRPSGPADVVGGMSFLGAPLFLDDLMFLVARRDDELFLLAMDHETGHLRWSLNLGVLAAPIAEAVSRRRIALPVTLVDGLLLCPTACGALVAVNPTTRAADWAARYPILQHDLPARPANGVSIATIPDVWWDEWRETKCLPMDRADAVSRAVVLTSPDSDQLLAWDIADGARLWSAPRSGGLHLCGVTRDLTIVVEPMAVRAHELRTGRRKWRTEVGEISGCGTIVGQQLIQPLRAGGFAIINVDDGAQHSVMGDRDNVYGTLIPVTGGWVTQADHALQRLPLLEDVRVRAAARWESERSEGSALELARLDIQSGHPAEARQRLSGNLSNEARTIRREAILAILGRQSQIHANATPKRPQDRPELERELLELCETDEERLIALRAMGDAALAADDLTGALTHFANGLDLVNAIGLRSVGDWAVEPVSTRIVRADRVLLGSIQRIFDDPRTRMPSAETGHSALKDLEQILESRLANARRSEDPFAVQRLLDRMLPLDWARRAMLANSTEAFYARTFQKSEPLLLAAAGSRDRSTSALACEQLADLLLRSGWRSHSEAIQRRMLSEHVGTPLSDGKTLAASLASHPDRTELRRRLLSAIPESWPSGLPTVEKESRRLEEFHQVPVRIQSCCGGQLDGIDVHVNRQAKWVRFSGAGYADTWDLPLPKSQKVLRSRFAHDDQLEAFAVGRLLVLRIGSEVFGILPFNERGEPRATRTDLQLDIAPSGPESPVESWWLPEAVPGRPGMRHDGIRMVDGFGRTLEGLSPVRPGYLCYRSQAKLVAVDTQTGRRLWERRDLPPNCRVTGDDDFVYLQHHDDRSVQVLSAIDGCSLREHPWTVAPDEVLTTDGRFTWTVLRQPVTTVELKDAWDGTTVWSRQFPRNAIPFVMDRTSIGVVDPAGLLHLLEADTGASRGEALTIEAPDKIERIVCLSDAQRWYVCVSGPVPRLPNLQGEQPWGGLRTAFVNGWLYGIDRTATSISWRRFVDSEPLPLTASRVVPLLVQIWRRPVPDGGPGNNAQGILRLIDTRTGQEILTYRDPSMQPYYSVVPAENRESAVIHTERETFRLNYSATASKKP